ncbi:thiol reductase thioredoxin [Mycolicibacterium agri]|uniref:Thioredoxin n=1 Tax=Mycolicibacterium agri TaxID=36811 RepID=A0A2A7NG22_MYCAG|nr:thioredoxin domain-containing protein [Mycolicibacterium agri]PEG42713.1 thiol reductase thioredoxin [Mycolicibacterium agri]GFG52697.1 thioredoxin [Mycolicibacterium agri]
MDDHGSSFAEIEEVTGDDPRALLDRPGLVLVQFWAEWCSPCHAMRAEIERFAAEAHDDVAICAVDITESPRTTQHFGVSSVPSIVILRDGETVHRSAGAKRRSQIARLVAGAR